MKIRLARIGPYTCLPLPEAATANPAFAAGAEVEVLWDAPRARILVRALTPRAEEADPSAAGDFAGAVEEFLDQFGASMKELASL